MPRYSTTPYGLKPAARVQFPQNARAISTAPQATARQFGFMTATVSDTRRFFIKENG